MKPISKLILCSLSMLFIFFISFQRLHAQQATDGSAYVSYNDFYQDLAPYGQWIDEPQYGYVWSPNVDGTFRPYYTNGNWAMTEYGNTWVSNYPWGWACFHYGRWTYDNYYGWIWIPGSTWGPAWVSWRYGDGYYGWAPLNPNYTFDASYGDYFCPNSWWVFIPPQYIYSGNYYHYWNGPHGNSEIIKNTTFVKNTYVNNNVTFIAGPHAKDIEDITHQPIQVFHLANSKNLTTKVHDNVVKMHQPGEMKPASIIDGQRITPPDIVTAPQPVSKPQPVKTNGQPVPEFRNNLPKNNGHEETPGANVNDIARPALPQPKYETSPYEYDVNRPVPQPQPRQEILPQPTVARQPQPAMNRPQPIPQQTSRATPAPVPARTQSESGRR